MKQNDKTAPRKMNIKWPLVGLIVWAIFDLAVTFALAAAWLPVAQKYIPHVPLTVMGSSWVAAVVFLVYALPEMWLSWSQQNKLPIILVSFAIVKLGLALSGWQLWTKGFDLLWLHTLSYLVLVVMTLLFSHLLLDEPDN